MQLLESFNVYKEEMILKYNAESIRTIWLWNMNVSFLWSEPSSYVISRIGESVTMQSDRWPELGILNALLASDSDVVVSEDIGCGMEILDYWCRIGIKTPKMFFLRDTHNYNNVSEAALVNPDFKTIVTTPSSSGERCMIACFGNSHFEERLAQQNGALLFGAGSYASAICNNKVQVKQWCKDLGINTPDGEVCESMSEVERVASKLFKRYKRIVIKEPYGVSGKGMVIVNTMNKVKKIIQIINMQRHQEGRNMALIVEGWYDKVKTHNSQFMILPSGNVYFIGCNEQILREQKYEGNYISRNWRQYCAGKEVYDDQMRLIEKVYNVGYHGVIGIDSFSSTCGSVFPAVEINARLNMSTYVHAMLERIGFTFDACAMTYTFKWRQRTSLEEFVNFIGKEYFYTGGQGIGIIPITYAGSSNYSTNMVMKTMLLYLGQDLESVESLRENVEQKLKGMSCLHR